MKEIKCELQNLELVISGLKEDTRIKIDGINPSEFMNILLAVNDAQCKIALKIQSFNFENNRCIKISKIKNLTELNIRFCQTDFVSSIHIEKIPDLESLEFSTDRFLFNKVNFSITDCPKLKIFTALENMCVSFNAFRNCPSLQFVNCHFIKRISKGCFRQNKSLIYISALKQFEKGTTSIDENNFDECPAFCGFVGKYHWTTMSTETLNLEQKFKKKITLTENMPDDLIQLILRHHTFEIKEPFYIKDNFVCNGKKALFYQAQNCSDVIKIPECVDDISPGAFSTMRLEDYRKVTKIIFPPSFKLTDSVMDSFRDFNHVYIPKECLVNIKIDERENEQLIEDRVFPYFFRFLYYSQNEKIIMKFIQSHREIRNQLLKIHPHNLYYFFNHLESPCEEFCRDYPELDTKTFFQRARLEEAKLNVLNYGNF